MTYILIPIYDKNGVVAHTKISPCDVEVVLKLRWYLNGKGYVQGGKWNRDTKKNDMVKLHRLLLSPSKYQHVDHVNGDKLDNTRENLRLATPQQNQCNQGIRKNNKSGYKGVSFHRAANKWQATISVNGKSIGLGLHLTPESAYEAYCTAAKEYHGEFYNVG